MIALYLLALYLFKFLIGYLIYWSYMWENSFFFPIFRCIFNHCTILPNLLEINNNNIFNPSELYTSEMIRSSYSSSEMISSSTLKRASDSSFKNISTLRSDAGNKTTMINQSEINKNKKKKSKDLNNKSVPSLIPL